MTLATPKATKPLRRLRKSLKNFPANPRPEEVHNLRTQTRRLEATVKAFTVDHDRACRLLKLIVPLRKAAGKVRDMDVLIEHVLSMQEEHPGEALVRLVEYLAEKRARNLRKLEFAIACQRKKACRRLKRYEKALKDGMGAPTQEGTETIAPMQSLAAELGHWPKLGAENLHPFRIRVKELHYMLELRTNTRGMHMAALAKVKDTAGEWHDWVELLKAAEASLDPKRDAHVLREIAAVRHKKLTAALVAANALRQQGFEPMSRLVH
jgi:CHAD domain-containing protein